MITDLRLQNFRSYRDSAYELSQGVNIIVGPNAAGKTNLLEAVLVLTRGVSYRAKDAEMVKFGAKWARIEAHTDIGGSRTFKIALEPKTSHILEVDSKAYSRITLNHTLPTVLFEPNHLRLLSGGPERRREYMDDLLEQTRPGYGTVRRQYKRALAQRNALLKTSKTISESNIFPWNIRLSQLAGQIVRARTELSEQLDAKLGGLYKELSGSKTKVSLKYETSLPVESYESALIKKLENDIELDKARGFTGCGPHREDMAIYFDGRPSQETASRGETRTAILGLKIIEMELIEKVRETKPILLLDDVFSELDGKRRHALTSYLSSHQTFITTTDADVVLHDFTNDCNVIALT